jgi:DNA-binding NarL/FixJ family response regulator
MKNRINLLIIEDHEIISEVYETVLRKIELTENLYNFKVENAFDCESALEKLNSSFYDIVFLDISLPSKQEKIKSGEDLGIYIRNCCSDTKIIVSTSYNSTHIINNLIKSINPEGLLIKSDLNSKELKNAIVNVIENPPYYTNTVLNFLKNTVLYEDYIDQIDRQILYQLSISTNMNDISNFIPLSKSGIEKRKIKLMMFFKITSLKNRDLVLKAQEKGFI